MERNTREPESLRLTPRCGAKRRDGLPCQKPRAKGWSRCKLHGGAPGSGAPRGEANGRYSHGLLTVEAIEERIALSEVLERSVKWRRDTPATTGRVPEEPRSSDCGGTPGPFRQEPEPTGVNGAVTRTTDSAHPSKAKGKS
jgi:hypothetical protein